ncbi:hypothetical protein M5K25_000765 [Dendrobium thyrsiflorum]|uniref:Late embryogenesis abundant protein LEA-2 subgroup domain-containing protein n=1 Tax=Dendrobium thyrsiflorum TaxID=117978 RepID=A0ABD0W6M8_DENTH
MNQPPPQQSHLGTGYYGPPIYAYPQPPPPPNDHFRRLLTIAIRAFIAFCVAFGLAILILWLVFRPQKMRIAVSSASLRRFDLTSSSGTRFLSFDLSANLTFRNPNTRAGIYYDWLEADADFDGMRLGTAGLPAFYQARKETREVLAVFQGRLEIGTPSGSEVEYQRDNATGVFSVDLWIFGRVRYKFGSAVTRRYIMRAVCPAKLPLGKVGFSYTDCKVLDL